MSTSSVLKEAWSAVEEADLPENIQEIAFREAVRLIAPPWTTTPLPPTAALVGATGVGSSSLPSRSNVSDTASKNPILISVGEMAQKVSEGTGVDSNTLSDLIYLDDGVLRLALPGIRLGSNNADRTRSIAAIFTVVRSFGLDEDDTSVELVREEAQRLKCYDSANFASQLKALQGFVIKGTGINRRIQAKGSGITEFPSLIAKLTGEH